MRTKPTNTKSAIRTRFLLALFVLPFILSSCTTDYHGKPNTEFYKKPIQTLNNITLHRSKEGKVIAILKSPLVESYSGDKSKTVFPKGLKVTFLNDDLTDKAILSADYAISYDSSDLVYIKDSVRIINYNNKDTMYCQDIYWNAGKKIIYSNKPIRRISASGQDYGDGMTANEVFDNVTIINPHGKQNINE